MDVLTVNDGDFVTLSEGAAYTAAYRDQFPSMDGVIKGLFIGKNKINDLLNQTNVVGVRIYFGLNDEGVANLVVVGAKASGDDVTDLIVERLKPCPPYCGNGNALNGN
ncbi:MAG: hypothetical protein JNL95_14470 [Chitinophagales bacterium]|nr:hypothetical protein [Chitinophagales bacterium]